MTTGLLGLACFLVWLFGAARMACAAPSSGLRSAMLAVELVEPVNIAILPLAFLALGAATAVRRDPRERKNAPTVNPPMGNLCMATAHGPRTVRSAFPVSAPSSRCVLALFLGVTMVTGDAYMFRGTNFGPGQPFNLAAARDANLLLPYWPDPALELSQIEAFDSLSRASTASADLAEARQWTVVAVRRDSHSPQLWTLLADADVELKAYGSARTEYYRALSCDKWFTQALQGLGQLAGLAHNWNEAASFYQRALTTASRDPHLAAPIRALLSSAQRHARSVDG